MLIAIIKATNVMMIDFSSVIDLDKRIVVHYSGDQEKYSNHFRLETR